MAETEKLAAETGWWGEMPAVRAGRVAVVDGNQLLHRPGPRLAETAEVLAEILHPGATNAGLEGSLWERVAKCRSR